MNLTKKGWGRIYVADPKFVDAVKRIIRELDEFEYTYLPEGMVCGFSEYPRLVYTHKFCDMDMNLLTAACWNQGIWIWVCDNGYSEVMSGIRKPVEES
jgi:hypothetical protein